jgi:hypothetical protein
LQTIIQIRIEEENREHMERVIDNCHNVLIALQSNLDERRIPYGTLFTPTSHQDGQNKPSTKNNQIAEANAQATCRALGQVLLPFYSFSSTIKELNL